MFANVKFWTTFITSVCIIVGPMMDRSSAETVKVAKKCEVLTAKVFPPREVGNPAAGSAKGTGKAERDYYRKCVANGGNMNEGARKGTK